MSDSITHHPLPFKCSNCGRLYPLNTPQWKCPTCGGLFNLSAPAVFDSAQVDEQVRGIWRYRHTFPLPPEAEPVTLGEGDTPLVPINVEGRTVHFKLEGLNPTGSFKDRGMAVMFTGLKAVGIEAALEDSSGNAGAAFAGYAARAGVRAQVFVPASAAGPKRQQIEAYGAELFPIEGPRSKASEAAQQAARGVYYGSHIYNPLGLAGNATAAFEIWHQLGHAPENIILPVGHGTLLLGLQRGFKALRAAQLIDHLPRLIAVQALACAPLWAVQQQGREGLGWVTEGQTLAEGIRVIHPVRGDAVLQALAETGGRVLAVDEASIHHGRHALARLGLYAEPTCGVVWEAIGQVPGEVVVILTGNGLKSLS